MEGPKIFKLFQSIKSLHKVAKTGSYNDLNDLPSIIKYPVTTVYSHTANNNIYCEKYGKLVQLNCAILINNITKDTWKKIATIPSEIIPKRGYGTSAIVSNADTR